MGEGDWFVKYGRGEVKRARRAMNKGDGVKSYTILARLSMHLGDGHASRGNTDKARVQYRNAGEMYQTAGDRRAEDAAEKLAGLEANLGGKTEAVVASVLVVAGFLFLFPKFTGNAVLGLGGSGSGIIGAVLFFLAVVGIYLFIRKN